MGIRVDKTTVNGDSTQPGGREFNQVWSMRRPGCCWRNSWEMKVFCVVLSHLQGIVREYVMTGVSLVQTVKSQKRLSGKISPRTIPRVLRLNLGLVWHETECRWTLRYQLKRPNSWYLKVNVSVRQKPSYRSWLWNGTDQLILGYRKFWLVLTKTIWP